jgi:PAS domain S-box-containing protein
VNSHAGPLGERRRHSATAVATEGLIAGKGEQDFMSQIQLEGELRSILDSVRCGIVLTDSNGAIRWVNETFRTYFGANERSTIILVSIENLAQLIAPQLREPNLFLEPWKKFRKGSGDTQHDEIFLSGPSRRVLERDCRPVTDGAGKRIGWLEVYRDITSQRQIQSKLLQTEKMAALGQLVSGIAHELNNPLTSIMGYAQLLLGRGATTVPNGEAKMIFEEAERARHIVKNLLFFARQAEPERTRVDVNEIVERTLALRGYELKVENIAVTSELALDLPSTLADPFQLQQAVLNLLTNAERAILEGRGHGHIQIRTRKISDARLAIEVTDDGPGIPQEISSRIFDPFFTTKAPGVGTGLGLSIVYGIIEQHGGDVTFENQREGGVKFTIELPIVAAPVFQRTAPAAPLSASVQPHSARVLVVEDEPTVARLVADVLREEGHQVETVLDSQEGLTRISRHSYDLIICDLRMPRLDGPAFYDALVRSGSSARDRILFITGDTLGQRTIEFLKSRQLPFLGKPFLVEELKLAVNRVLQSSAGAATVSR